MPKCVASAWPALLRLSRESGAADSADNNPPLRQQSVAHRARSLFDGVRHGPGALEQVVQAEVAHLRALDGEVDEVDIAALLS